MRYEHRDEANSWKTMGEERGEVDRRRSPDGVCGMDRRAGLGGGVSEWPKEHAWKACVRHKRTVGSNPTSSDDATMPVKVVG